MKRKVELMLDSGVFSAWNRGGELDLKEYINYVKRNERYLACYVNMDVIPGVFGRKRTMTEVEQSASKGYDNLQEMKSHGLRPIPVFHQGERFEWLERLIADGETHIGISNAKDLRTPEQRAFLDAVFTILCNSKGRPYVRTHGFGVTNPHFLFRYPWTTVDSTTWSLTPGYGQTIVPVYRNGVADYQHPPVRVTISGVVQQSSSGQRKQFEALGPMLQECVRLFLEQEVQCSVAQARYDTNMRRAAVTTYFLRLMQHMAPVNFSYHNRGMMRLKVLNNSRVLPQKTVQIFFATRLLRNWSQLLNRLNANTRLLSYYELRTLDDEKLHEYVMRGTHGEYNRKVPKANWNETYMNHRRLKLLDRINTNELVSVALEEKEKVHGPEAVPWDN